MRSDLASDATVNYGEFAFPTSNLETIALEGRPVYDSAGRTVIYVLYSITLRCYLDDTSDTGIEMMDVRRELQKPAQSFSYMSKGFGSFAINVAGPEDAVWGPKPQMLSWKPVGNNKACELTWRVEVAIPECGNDVAYAGRPMEFCYKLGFSIDASGYTRRTYTGHVRIPQTRIGAGTRTLADNADAYRERCTPALVQGFKRVSQDYTLDESKCRLDFTVVDQQLPANAFPEGIVEATADHAVESLDRGFCSWGGTISATYEVAADKPKTLATKCFAALVKDRLSASAKVIGAARGARQKGTLTPIPVRLSIREPEIYGRKTAVFSLQYRFCTNLAVILQASSLWRPVPEANWQRWQASMGNVLGPRGLAGAKFNNQDDIIVDLCYAGAPPKNQVALRANPDVKAGLEDLLNVARPAPAESWMDYQCSLYIEILTETAELKRLPLAQVVYKPDQQAVASGVDTPGLQLIPFAPGAKDNAIQLRVQPTIAITLEGYGIRAGYEVSAPVLKTVGGRIPKLANKEGNYIRPMVLADFGLAVHGCSWSQRYIVANVPVARLAEPENYLIGT